MKRRDFLVRTVTAVSASLLPGSFRSDSYRFVSSALAASGGDDQKVTLEQKFAEFALSIKYGDLPADVIASAKRVLLDTLGCALGSVGSEPANIAETTIRKTFGDGNTATVMGYPRPATVETSLNEGDGVIDAHARLIAGDHRLDQITSASSILFT